MKKNLNNLFDFLNKYKYEVLLVGLFQHLFVGIFLKDTLFYTEVVWPINMMILGVLSLGIFSDKTKFEQHIKNVLFIIVLILPFIGSFFKNNSVFLEVISVLYTLYFGFIFYEVIIFLLKPSKISTDILFASACAYMLIVEMFTFTLQYMFYCNPKSLINVNVDNVAYTFMDIAYFCIMTITTVGYGDIVPNTHNAKLFVSFYAIFGQFYSLILVGILVGKYSTYNFNNE